MKRLGNIWNDVTNVDLAISDVIEGTKNKRGRRETQKLLYDSEIVAEHSELWHQIDPAKAITYADVQRMKRNTICGIKQKTARP